MGFLDNLFNAVESGALEAKLGKVADVIEKQSGQVDAALTKAAGKPGDMLQAAEAKKNAIKTAARHVADAAHKKD